ncbi:hypothetical protein AMTRI_Chr06g169800 [Amborella trichopoda]|uniref:pentatricopeptide repeat-containing protein At5g61800-like n=1 Tax=Amborella trichopoda TaxID=13333 RepID=UPI0009BDCB57|nr:pentatricopeptide repeat-containing protein At5g61800-like [Amborella trichopoda]|eukprot:XP_011623475.2 pentatricopeptide repeat-containing protein At5g61800-like [Amborella trichopoda]
MPQSPTHQAILLLSLCTHPHHLGPVHAHLVKTALSRTPTSIAKLLRFFYLYPNLDITYALSIFHSVPNPTTFSLNTIIRAFTQSSNPIEATKFYAQMHSNGIRPDTHTFPFVLKACALMRELDLGRSIHCQAVTTGLSSDIFVQNTLIHMYSSSGSLVFAQKVFDGMDERDAVSYNAMIACFVRTGGMDFARKLFDEMPERNVVSWGTVLAGYAQVGQSEEALELFDSMLHSGFRPDNVALVTALSACAQLGALEKGKMVHDYVKRTDIRLDVYLATGLIDMYAKCGCIESARAIFDASSERNDATWNAMIVGLAMHGHGELALEFFDKMQKAGVKPDGITFVGVLTACTHAGLVNLGRTYFNTMEPKYEVVRELKHYGCMADLLGRAGLLDEIHDMIKHMPKKPDVFVWGGLLGGCRIHNNVKLAEIAVEHMLELDPDDSGIYSIMANIYASARQWDDVAKIRKRMYGKRVRKMAGFSLIEVGGCSHEFVAGDRLHPDIDEIYEVLDGMRKQLKGCWFFC